MGGENPIAGELLLSFHFDQELLGRM